MDLERPELFADGLHLNRDGRPIFSERLAAKTESILNGGSR
jgi:lysophospholipase L1-like esterase